MQSSDSSHGFYLANKTEHIGGLGAASPLAYTDHFWVETWTNEEKGNIYRKWVQYIDTSRIGALSLLEEKEWSSSEEKTGTQVTIPFDSKDLSAVNTALGFYLSYTDAKYNLLEKTKDALNIGKKSYTHYGLSWALDLKNYSNSSRYAYNIDKNLIIIGDIPYRLEYNTIASYFNYNIKELIPIVNSQRPKYIKDDETNERLFMSFIKSLSCHKFELKLEIGSVDLNASREDLQYTDRTCSYIFTSLYKMFLEMYAFIRMDLVNHPNYVEACIIYNKKYHGGFRSNFLCEVRWAKENIAFGINPKIFTSKTTHEQYSYELDTVNVYSDNPKNILRKRVYERLLTGHHQYEIILQDTEYKNVSKFIKYYAESKEDKFSYIYICVHPHDLEKIYNWIVESLNIVKLSKLVANFKINAPITAGNKAKSGTFKALTFRSNNIRPRAEGISNLFDYEEVSINAERKMYYICKEEWDSLPSYLESIKSYNRHNRINSDIENYLNSKNIDNRDLIFTPKVTRNFKHENWINFIDLLKEDYKKYSSYKSSITKSLYTCSYVENTHDIFIKLNEEKIDRKDSNFLYLKNFYLKELENLNNNKETVLFLRLVYEDLSYLSESREGIYYYSSNVKNLLSDNEECLEIRNLYEDYINKLPFLRLFNDYKLLDRYEIEIDSYIHYINLMEKEHNLYIKEKSPVFVQETLSEFKLLEESLINQYHQVT